MGGLYRLVGVALLVLIGCTEPSEIGGSFFKEGSLGVVYTDTLSLHVSTVISDSLVTGNSSRLLIGYHADTDLGKVYSSAFFQLEPKYSDNEEVFVYDLSDISTDYLKTTLILYNDSYSYYDTLNYQTLYVHELKNKIETEEDGYLYNTSKTDFYNAPLGQLTFRPRPNSRDSIEIPLADYLGTIIYEMAVNADESLSNADVFTEDILNGLVILPDTTVDGAILGFDTKAELRVHYLDRSVVPSAEKYIRFFVSSHYNQIISKRDATPLNELVTHKESLSSSLTSRKAYIQGGVGLSTRVEIPYLKSTLIDNPDLIFTRAYLTFKPVKGINKNNTSLPLQLKAYAVNKKNEVYADLLSSEEEEGFVYLFADTDLDRDTYYKIDVTYFIKNQLAIEEFNSNALLFSLKTEELNNTVNRAYVGDQKSDFDMELKLYYTVVR